MFMCLNIRMSYKFVRFLTIFVVFMITSATIAFADYDGDSDGTPDADDKCPDSGGNTDVDSVGCSCPQKLKTNCNTLYPGINCCPSDNNDCTDDCSMVSRIATCG